MVTDTQMYSSSSHYALKMIVAGKKSPPRAPWESEWLNVFAALSMEICGLVPGIELRCIIRCCIIRVLYHMKLSILMVSQIACIELHMEPRICGINSI
jgi:hypothetical protein